MIWVVVERRDCPSRPEPNIGVNVLLIVVAELSGQRDERRVTCLFGMLVGLAESHRSVRIWRRGVKVAIVRGHYRRAKCWDLFQEIVL